MSEEGQPRRALTTGLRTVMLGENATNEVPVDLDAERGRDDQRDARTAEAGIAALELDDCVNEICGGSLGAGLAALLRREQLAVLPSDEVLMKAEQSSRSDCDGDSGDASRADKQCAEAED